MKDLLIILVFVIVIKLMGISINKPVVKDTTDKQVAKTEINKVNFEQTISMPTLTSDIELRSNLGLIMPFNKVSFICEEHIIGQVLTFNQTINYLYNAKKKLCTGVHPPTSIYSDS